MRNSPVVLVHKMSGELFYMYKKGLGMIVEGRGKARHRNSVDCCSCLCLLYTVDLKSICHHLNRFGIVDLCLNLKTPSSNCPQHLQASWDWSLGSHSVLSKGELCLQPQITLTFLLDSQIRDHIFSQHSYLAPYFSKKDFFSDF